MGLDELIVGHILSACIAKRGFRHGYAAESNVSFFAFNGGLTDDLVTGATRLTGHPDGRRTVR